MILFFHKYHPYKWGQKLKQFSLYNVMNVTTQSTK